MTTHLSLDRDFLGSLANDLRNLLGYATLAHELIQNADDAGASVITFNVTDTALVVTNNSQFQDCGHMDLTRCPWEDSLGRRCDFHRFRLVASGDKRREHGTTGAFGIGFTAVYQITDRPELISHGRHWIITPEAASHRRIEERQVPDTEGTRFILPWATDPDTPVRHGLQASPFDLGRLDAFTDELARALPTAIIFLRHLDVLELQRNGATVTRLTRSVDDNLLLINNGSTDTLWYLLRGSFDFQADDLRAAFPGRIESKRSAAITIAILPQDLPKFDGLLCAFLPTDQSTGLPFHINADFYPSSDRKRVLFDVDSHDEYQSRWNKAAISCAAAVLSANLLILRDQLAHATLWALFDRLAAVHEAAQKDSRLAVFSSFWSLAKRNIPQHPLVYTSTGTWRFPSAVHLLYSKDEEACLPLLEQLGLPIVHPELRPYFTLFRQLQVPILSADVLAHALTAAQLSAPFSADAAPAWFKSEMKQTYLAQLIQLLLDRPNTVTDPVAMRRALAACPIALAADGWYRAPSSLFHAPASTIDLFRPLGLAQRFVDPSNPDPILGLAAELTVSAALDLLSAVPPDALTALWVAHPDAIIALIDWFSRHRHDVKSDQHIKTRLRCLPLWPAGPTLGPLDRLVLPGNFEDPLRLADIVDSRLLVAHRDFLRELDVPELTVPVYARTYVPRTLDGPHLSADQRRHLVDLLACRLGELRNDPAVHLALAACPIVECTDGVFRRPSEAYFDTDDVRLFLGPPAPIVALPETSRVTVADLFAWLGVASQARPADILRCVHSLVHHPPQGDTRRHGQAIFSHIATRWLEGDEQFRAALAPLKNLAWLPARDKFETWFSPTSVYAVFQDYLFDTQADFLDIGRNEQNAVADFLDFLDVPRKPQPYQVVRHLLHCAQADKLVNREVYTYLNQNSADSALDPLLDQPCLLLEGIGYVRPDQVYLRDNPYAPMRYQLDGSWRQFSTLLARLRVREAPAPLDAVAVLRDISAERSASTALDESWYALVMRCWTDLTRHLEAQSIAAADLVTLRDLPVIPDDRRLLRHPIHLFFEDRPGLAAKFGPGLAHDILVRPEGAWRAMQAAGVRSLSLAVEFNLAECEHPVPDTLLPDRLQERRPLMARVLEGVRAANPDPWRLAALDTLQVRQADQLVVSYSLHTHNRHWPADPDPVTVFYARRERVLYYRRQDPPPWAALARELVYALNPTAEAGQLASGLKEVLSAPTALQASHTLDELGYAPLDPSVAASFTVAPVLALGGLPAPSEPLDAAPVEPTPPVGPSPTQSDDFTPADALRLILGPLADRPADLPPAPYEPRSRPAPASTTNGHPAPQPEPARSPASSRGKLRTYTVPPGVPTSPDPNPDAQATRSAVDQAGITAVLAFEQAAGRHPQELPHHNPGYDILSYDPWGRLVRTIEVKSTRGAWDSHGVGLSATQFETALDLGDSFWLYIVEHAETPSPHILCLQDPARRVTQYLYDDGWRALAEADATLPSAPAVLQSTLPFIEP